MKRALITGITGQDGRHLAQFLAAKGYQVFGLIRGQGNPKAEIVQRETPALELVDGDLRDLSSLIAAVDFVQPDEVYNLGAISFVHLSFTQPELTSEITGLGVLRIKGWTTFLSNTTPIDEENLLVRWIFTSPRELGERAPHEAADQLCSGVSQDIPIWENKIYRDPPVLRPMEKGVTEHRRWCRQFYSYVDETHPGLSGS